jgi:hypothetical protein
MIRSRKTLECNIVEIVEFLVQQDRLFQAVRRGFESFRVVNLFYGFRLLPVFICVAAFKLGGQSILRHFAILKGL